MQLSLYYLITVILMILILVFYKNRSQQSRFRFLIGLAVLNFVAYAVNWVYFYLKANIMTLLPLQLCNLAVFLIPAALITKKAVLMDFVFYVCGLGALVAILIPGSDYAETYSMMTISFYIFHCSIFVIPVLNSIWGFHVLKPTLKSALKLSLMVLVISGALHGLNLFLNQVYDIPANYFFTIKDLAAPTNPAFALFASWIPYDYFYLSLAFPILFVYMGLVGLIMRIKLPHKVPA